MEYKLQLHEFFIEGGNREKSHVLLHITEPSTASEKQKGYFFAICELNEGDTKKIVRLQNIIDEIEGRYYEAPESINEHSLETVLKKINREHKQDEKLDNLHSVLGVIRNESIVFSYCGTPKMLLFYQTKDGTHKKMDLINESDDANEDLFSQIVEGKITPNDFLFIATPRLKEYFTDDRLQKIITTRPARQSAAHIEKVLSDIHNEISFGGLVIHLKEEEISSKISLPKKTFLKGGSIKSLNNLFATEKNTANTLSPSLFPQLNKLRDEEIEEPENIEQYRPTVPTEISATHLRQLQPRTTAAQNEDKFKKYLLLFASGFWTSLKFLGKVFYWLIMMLIKIIIEISNKLLLLFFVTTNYQNRRRNIVENWMKQWQACKVYFKTMPKTTKIMFGLIILVIVAFVGSIMVIRSRQAQLAQQQKDQEVIRQISIHKDAADSAVIFKDNNTALNESKTVKQLISQLNCKNYKKQCDDFNSQIDGILSQIKKETIAEPQLLYDFGQSQNNFGQLTRINNQILAFSNTSTNIAIYDLLTKQSRTIDSKITGFNDAAVPKENDYIAFLYNNKDIVTYNPKDSTFTGAEIAYPNQSVKITSLIVYNRRLYTLDQQNGQIYKHENIKTGFASGKDWLKDLSVNIKNAVSLTTDGDMFVGENNGQIEKITAGTKQTFAVSGLDPELKSVNKIWSYTDKQYLYILDSENKRLVILQKDGTLYSQITAAVWKHPTGLIIDEPNKRAFILDSNKLWEINI